MGTKGKSPREEKTKDGDKMGGLMTPVVLKRAGQAGQAASVTGDVVRAFRTHARLEPHLTGIIHSFCSIHSGRGA